MPVTVPPALTSEVLPADQAEVRVAIDPGLSGETLHVC